MQHPSMDCLQHLRRDVLIPLAQEELHAAALKELCLAPTTSGEVCAALAIPLVDCCLRCSLCSHSGELCIFPASAAGDCTKSC